MAECYGSMLCEGAEIREDDKEDLLESLDDRKQAHYTLLQSDVRAGKCFDGSRFNDAYERFMTSNGTCEYAYRLIADAMRETLMGNPLAAADRMSILLGRILERAAEDVE